MSAPVVDDRGKLVGRVTVDAARDFLRDDSNLQALKRAGLSGDEDLFAAPRRDPAHGSSVLLTFITDAMGFFLFLGLASVFLR